MRAMIGWQILCMAEKMSLRTPALANRVFGVGATARSLSLSRSLPI